MELNSSSITFVVAAIVLVTSIISGPLVGFTDFSVNRPDPGYTPDETLGDGRVNLTIVRIPNQLQLVQGEYGNEGYQLQIPPAIVQIDSVVGHPILTYKIRVPGLNLIRIQPHFLSPSNTGRIELRIDSEKYTPEQINRSEYTARLKILKRENGTMTMLRNVTVPIEVVK